MQLIDFIQKAFYGVKWSKLEEFFDVIELILSKMSLLRRKSIFSRFIFTHKHYDTNHQLKQEKVDEKRHFYQLDF